jgi:uncharacterized lipoprotein YehR (DUF1307 family)
VKRKLIIILFATIILFSVTGCGETYTPVGTDSTVSPSTPTTTPSSTPDTTPTPSSTPSSSYTPSDSDSSTAKTYPPPRPGESISEYMKEQDPELYNTVKQRIEDSVTNDNSNGN